MAAKNSRKRFSAELKMLRERGIIDAEASGNDGDLVVEDVSNSELLQAIKSLAEMQSGVLPDAGDKIFEIDEKLVRDAKMATDLKNEVRAMSRSIQETKSEIRAMRAGTKGGDKFLKANTELDAVVLATEEATNTILESSERIDGLAEKLQRNAASEEDRKACEDIMETTIRILEACNFQDITGQRITKVVHTLQYVDDRINSMVEIWGDEDINAVDSAVSEDDDTDADLLNGPALDDTGVSQDDIDALFD